MNSERAAKKNKEHYKRAYRKNSMHVKMIKSLMDDYIRTFLPQLPNDPEYQARLMKIYSKLMKQKREMYKDLVAYVFGIDISDSFPQIYRDDSQDIETVNFEEEEGEEEGEEDFLIPNYKNQEDE